jgi:hypothetical protein
LELAEAGAGVGKSPTGQLDLKPVERGVDEIALSIIGHFLPAYVPIMPRRGETKGTAARARH